MERDNKGRFIKGHSFPQEVKDRISATKTIFPTEITICETCDKPFQFRKDKNHPIRKYCSVNCRNNKGFKVGKLRLTKNGYIQNWNPNHPLAYKDGQVLIHRQVWYDHYGELPKGFHIHHKNGNKKDNRIENLELHSNSKHQKIHHPKGSFVKNQFGVFLIKKG